MYILWITLAFLFLSLIRVIMGPTIWDRLLGMNIVSTKIIIFIIGFAVIYETPYMLDYAIIYTLFGYISVIFIAFFLLDRGKSSRR